MLADWKTTIDVVCYVDLDWADCSKTRESASGSTVQVKFWTVTLFIRLELRAQWHCPQERPSSMALAKVSTRHCLLDH